MIVLVAVCLVLLVSPAVGETWNDTQLVYNAITSFYANNGSSLDAMIPMADQSKSMVLMAMMFLYSVDGFDAVKGEVEISGALFMEWTDATLGTSVGNFDYSSFNEGYSILIPPNKVWTPPLVLLNAVDTIQKVGGNEFPVRYHPYDGRMKWNPRTLIKAACKPNIEFYPYDRQECEFAFTAWGYTANEIQMDPSQANWYLCDYNANGIWRLVSSTSSTYTKDNQSFMKFQFVIERAPRFFIINIILPIIILGILNMFVFFTPAESGERVGFSITCFLTFVFMLQTVMNILPQTAEPMSIFVFYSVVMMVLSVLLSIATVITLRFYHKPEGAKPPKILQKVAHFLTFKWLVRAIKRCKKNSVHQDGGTTTNSSTLTVSEEVNDQTGIEEEMTGSESDLGRERSCSSAFSRNSQGGELVRMRTLHTDAKNSKENPRQSSSDSRSETSDGGKSHTTEDSQTTNDSQASGEAELSYIEVARILDFSFFCLFLIVKILCIFIFIIPMATKYT